MNELTEIVDNLENRISKLLHKYEVLKNNYNQLQEELTNANGKNFQLQQELKNSGEQIESLKAANAMLGSTEYKRETKLKINSLIKEIDQCIVQLSE